MAKMYVDIPTIKVGGTDYAVELVGDRCKVWESFGLPDFEGSLDVAAVTYPDLILALIKRGAIKLA